MFCFIRRVGLNRLSAGLKLGVGATLLLSACSVTDPAEETQFSAPGDGTVTVLGVIVGAEQANLEAALAPFEEETGIEVVYEGTDAFTTLLPVRVDSGEAPDIAMFPQPGLMKSLARAGELVPLDEVLERPALEAAYGDTWLDLGTVDGELYGIWYRAAVKSLVWYSPEEFEQRGYAVPETWDEMLALSDRIVADGGNPWCLGLESGNATGWPGTDWVEDILLRTAGPEYYDRWVEHEVPFNDEPVQAAFRYFGEIVHSDDYVWGGKVGALSIPWGDAPQGLFNSPPDCFMYRQGNFVTNFFPDDVGLGETIDVFVLPSIDPEYGAPMLVAGDVFAMLNNTPEARALMAYLATPTAHEIWAERGGFLSAHQQLDPAVYPDALSRKLGELLTEAEIVRFDGSDSMPGAVSTGTFWSGMMDFVAGSSAEEVTDTIERNWPETRTATE